MMRLHTEEPSGEPWLTVPLQLATQVILAAVDSSERLPMIVAIDGRSSSGKTTLSRRIHDAVPHSSVVHTDDIAWYQSSFDWADLLRHGILDPVRQGKAVSFRPPAWDQRGRPGSIDVPGQSSLVIVEGVGAARNALASDIDLSIWVQADMTEAEQRNAQRIAAGEVTPTVFRQWMAELEFLAAERPWDRADLLVAGTPPIADDAQTDLVVAHSTWARLVHR